MYNSILLLEVNTITLMKKAIDTRYKKYRIAKQLKNHPYEKFCDIYHKERDDKIMNDIKGMDAK